MAELTKLNAFLGSWSGAEDALIGVSDFDDCRAFIHLTCQNLQREIEHHIDGLDNQDNIAKYIRSSQVRLSYVADCSRRLADEFNVLSSGPQSGKQETALLFKEVNSQMIRLLDYLHVYFSNHFNHDAILPRGYCADGRQKTAAQRSEAIKGLSEKKVDENLIFLLDGFLCRLDNQGDELIKTWQQYDYLYDLSLELVSFSRVAHTGDSTLKLIKLLMAHDFNHVEFYAYMLNYVEVIASGNSSFMEKQILLNDLHLQLVTIRLERRAGYNTDMMPVRDSVCGSIEKRIKHLEVSGNLHTRHDTSGKDRKFSWFYFEVGSTIEELMFLTWVMVQVSFIKTRFHSHLYAFIENHIRAEQTKHPSPAYMRNHFGNKDVSAKVVRKVREWLHRMIFFIDTHFKDQLKR